MSTRFKNIQTFIRDVIRPYLTNLINMLKSEASYTDAKFTEVEVKHEQDITALQNHINQVESKADATSTELSTHEGRKDNPHDVKMTQLVIISSSPAPATGTPGTFWVQVLPN